MKIPLPNLLQDDSGLLKKIIADMSPYRITLEIKVYVHVLAESRRVIIAVRFCIAKRFQNCI
jgi:hypothetical protein